MKNFINQLIQRQKAELDNSVSAEQQAELSLSLTTLALGQASLNRLSLCKQNNEYPLQVVVTGPTQVGKSAVVNMLLQQPLADSSAQAGFTVHCQGFHVVTESNDLYATEDNWAAQFFSDLNRSEQNALDRRALAEYSLREAVIPDSVFNNAVVWDTPDFDSVQSFDYRAPLLKAVALADFIVFVVSKEKYADKTVWTMIELLAERNIPLVIVMNKTPVNVRQELQASIEKKYAAFKPNTECPPIAFIDEYPNDLTQAYASAALGELRQAIFKQLDRRDVKEFKQDTLEYCRSHWSTWTSGVSAEHKLQREYSAMVEMAVDSSVEQYKAEYIDTDRHREVIQLALSELLVLLEVPGLAKPLSKLRGIVTWPVRTFLAGAREPAVVAKDDRNEERRLLDELGKHTIASLSASLAAKEASADGPRWRELRSQVQGAEAQINSQYNKSLDNYQTLLNVEIDRAAQALYQTLQTQPMTLNSLRAARVTTDAAAVVLAVKSGGLGTVDLVVAPAMLSLTTMLTEGALGQYMQRTQKELTDYQEKEVKSILNRKLRKPLLALEQDSHANQTHLSEQDLKQVAAKLESGDV